MDNDFVHQHNAPRHFGESLLNADIRPKRVIVRLKDGGGLVSLDRASDFRADLHEKYTGEDVVVEDAVVEDTAAEDRVKELRHALEAEKKKVLALEEEKELESIKAAKAAAKKAAAVPPAPKDEDAVAPKAPVEAVEPKAPDVDEEAEKKLFIALRFKGDRRSVEENDVFKALKLKYENGK